MRHIFYSVLDNGPTEVADIKSFLAVTQVCQKWRAIAYTAMVGIWSMVLSTASVKMRIRATRPLSAGTLQDVYGHAERRGAESRDGGPMERDSHQENANTNKGSLRSSLIA